MQAFIDALRDSTTFWVLVSLAVLLTVGVLVADARPPRWLRARRRLADMFEAARVENERLTVQALIAAREAARSLTDDAYDIVEKHWPFDGPHSDETIANAATATGRLVRYMANATYRPVGRGADLWRIVYDDRHDRPGADTAAEVSILLGVARDELAEAAKALSVASSAALHLGNDEAVRRG